MSNFHHPAAKDMTVEGVLYALSDPLRVRIYADIMKSECSRICSNFLELDDRKIPKSTLSKHFKILRETGLIRSEKRGIEMHNVSRCDEFKEPFGGMIASIIEAYITQNKKNKSRKK